MQTLKKQEKKKLGNSLLSPKYKPQQLPNNFHASGDTLDRKFCQHNINLKCVNSDEDYFLFQSSCLHKLSSSTFFLLWKDRKTEFQ